MNPSPVFSIDSLQHLEFQRKPNGCKQPLYRPSALRRNQSYSSVIVPPSSTALPPPFSTSPSSPSAWTTVKGAFTAVVNMNMDRSTSYTGNDVDASIVRGDMMSKYLWKNDCDADACSDPSCDIKFSVFDRKHHCRKCGDLFCASHSSRSSLFWPPTPPASSSAASSIYNGATSTLSIDEVATPKSYFSLPLSSHLSASPPRRTMSPRGGMEAAVSARICDQCYYASPPPSCGSSSSSSSLPNQASFYLSNSNNLAILSPPLLSTLNHSPCSTTSSSAHSRYHQQRPLIVRHSSSSSSSRTSTPARSPLQSPIFDPALPHPPSSSASAPSSSKQARRQQERRRTSRSGSTTSIGSGLSESTPPTSSSSSGKSPEAQRHFSLSKMGGLSNVAVVLAMEGGEMEEVMEEAAEEEEQEMDLKFDQHHDDDEEAMKRSVDSIDHFSNGIDAEQEDGEMGSSESSIEEEIANRNRLLAGGHSWIQGWATF